MAQNFASRKHTKGKPRKPAIKKLFLLGLLLGLSPLLFLRTPVVPDEAPQAGGDVDANEDPQVDFTFFKKLLEPFPLLELPDQAAPEKPRTYFLQAAAFRSKSDAQRLKGEIERLGLAVEIRSSAAGKRTPWHRIIVGPFTSRPSMEAARSQLAQQDLSAVLLNAQP